MEKSGGRRRGEAIYMPYVARQDIASSQMGTSATDPECTQPSHSEAAFQPRFPLELWPQISSLFFHSQHIHTHRSVHLQVCSTFSFLAVSLFFSPLLLLWPCLSRGVDQMTSRGHRHSVFLSVPKAGDDS